MKIKSNFIDTGTTEDTVAVGNHTHSSYLSNENISSPANGQVLGYEDGVWKNIAITTTDTTAPILLSTRPLNNTTGVIVTSSIAMSFSKIIVAGTGDIIISNGTDTRTISVTDTSQVTFSSAVVTISPINNLNRSTKYYVQMASEVIKDVAGNSYIGISDTTTFNFTTEVVPAPDIGTAGGQGFGVGVYLGTLPSGFTEMPGCTTSGHVNYGNYQYSDGSIMVFIPRFYYRIGSTSSPRYYESNGVTVKYGLNAVDIVSGNTYVTETDANAAGYALHRAFVDGGNIKQGFFIDKYLASKNGTTSCKSVFGGDPISLYSSTTYTVHPSSTMTGCTGILADAVVLGRSREVGRFNCASIFQYSALAMLSLVHGQASTSATNCAWYSANGGTNYPKGCNAGNLTDTNDTSVVYAASYIDTYSKKPKTGATSNFNKTTHNGQACGVADLNGCMTQVILGFTQPSSGLTDGTAWVLQRSKKLADLTSGLGTGTTNGLITDAWGSTSHLSNIYEPITGIFPGNGSQYGGLLGNGSVQVFSGVTSGVNYHRTSCGIPDTINSTSSSGTNLFGSDSCYYYNCDTAFPTSSGNSHSNWSGGIFNRYFSSRRFEAYIGAGFRCAAYGDE
jgi:hypothetical protein